LGKEGMDDYKRIFDAIAAFLQEKGYGVVVDQVRKELATGRLTEEKIGLSERESGASLASMGY
jgi:hypothetical protein